MLAVQGCPQMGQNLEGYGTSIIGPAQAHKAFIQQEGAVPLSRLYEVLVGLTRLDWLGANLSRLVKPRVQDAFATLAFVLTVHVCICLTLAFVHLHQTQKNIVGCEPSRIVLIQFSMVTAF